MHPRKYRNRIALDGALMPSPARASLAHLPLRRVERERVTAARAVHAEGECRNALRDAAGEHWRHVDPGVTRRPGRKWPA
jgi:hypothetical protein